MQRTVKKAALDRSEKISLSLHDFSTTENIPLQPIAEPEDLFDDLFDKRLGLRFKFREGLIYYTNFDDGRKRLYILNILEKEIFELIYNRQHHEGFHRTYNRIANSIYFKHLSKHLRIYIDHYLKCELN